MTQGVSDAEYDRDVGDVTRLTARMVKVNIQLL